MVYEASRRGDHALIQPKQSRNAPSKQTRAPIRVPIPATISHYVLNLPASAITFLPCFRGLYAGKEELFTPYTKTELPLVHVHCFSAKAADDTPLTDICQRLYEEIGERFRLGDATTAGEVSIYDVRDVAPGKRMFCASFRLPPKVAFAPRSSTEPSL